MVTHMDTLEFAYEAVKVLFVGIGISAWCILILEA